MALQGDLRTVPLRDVLAWLSMRQASGTLSLSRGAVACRFQLRRGHVMLSTSTEEETMLGRLLIARGLIDAAQLQQALAETDGVRPRLGTALIRAGLVSADDLRGVLTDKVRRLLLDALAWTEGAFYFDGRAPAPKRPTIAAAFGLSEVLGGEAGAGDDATLSAADGGDDVIVTDEDIIEIVELPRPRRPPKLPRKRRAAKQAGPIGGDTVESNQTR
jgi:hypothetical protein